ncbi:MAG: (2Fe-2S)-binding protein [Pseudomonadota bacterium]
MIICSCAVISSDDIDRTVAWMKAADPQVVITPGKVYRALGKRAVCGGCAKLFVACVHKSTTSDVPAELRNLRTTMKGTASHEGRRQGNRLS